MRIVRVRLGLAAALLALVSTALLVSGCGATLDPVAQAATRTSDVSTLRFTMTMKLRLPTALEPVSINASGAVDSAAGRFGLTMDLSRLAALSGQGGQLGRMSIIEDGTVMYMGGGGLAGTLPGGKEWVRIDLSQAASRLGLDLSSLTGGQTDPRTSLAQLREAGNVVRIGPHSIKGVATTRYNVLLDLRHGVDRLKGASRDAMQQLVDRLEALGSRYVPADAWIDGDGYLRRFRMAIPNYLGTGSSVSLTMDLFDFGSAVDIAVPAASDVVDLGDSLSRVLGG
jgi:hypothetical protein